MKAGALIFFGLVAGFSSALYAASGAESASFLNIPVGAGPSCARRRLRCFGHRSLCAHLQSRRSRISDSTQVGGEYLSYLSPFISMWVLSPTQVRRRARGVGSVLGFRGYPGSGFKRQRAPQLFHHLRLLQSRLRSVCSGAKSSRWGLPAKSSTLKSAMSRRPPTRQTWGPYIR